MSLNLSHVFVRYPTVRDTAEAVQHFLSTRRTAQPEVPRHVCVQTGSPWIGIFAWGNNSPTELAEHLSRVLEAKVLWFGLSGRALAYRMRHYHLGKATDDTLIPKELFGHEDSFPLPSYPDAEQDLYALLKKEGIPDPYIFALAEEFGASARGEQDAIVVAAAPWSESGVQQEPFTQRLAKRPEATRTLFDQFDEERKTVTDAVVLRGTYEEERAQALLVTLERMVLRRAVPPGFTVEYRLESPAGPALLDPVGALFAKLRRPKRLSYSIAIEPTPAAR